MIGEEGEEEKDGKEKEVDKEIEKGSWRDKREGVRETNVCEEKRREEREGIYVKRERGNESERRRKERKERGRGRDGVIDKRIDKKKRPEIYACVVNKRCRRRGETEMELEKGF